MNDTDKIYIFLLIIISYGCTQGSDTEKYQKSRDNIVNVHDKIKEIEIETVLIGRNSQSYLIDQYLIICDYTSPDQQIHLFNKNNFRYLASTAYKGQGPGEISNIGHVGIDESRRKFYVTDHGKQKIFSYDLDSVLKNPDYIPSVKMEMEIALFPDKYKYINDTLCIGRVIQPIGTNDFKPYVAKWNMITGDIKLMPYEHLDIKTKRSNVTVSAKHNRYVEYYSYHDLMTICDLDGNLKCNIYGPQWTSDKSQISGYWDAEFCGDKIVAAYSGGDHRTDAYFPTKLLIFDLKGNYLKTLETGYKLFRFCYDSENNRLILCMDDDIQFGYLDLTD